eukprot:jgi/Mesvir1/7903/Mv11834-RA.1
MSRGLNILVTGTPGTGKTTLCERLASITGLTYINVGELVKEQELHEGYDEDFDSYVIDEEKVLDAMEDAMTLGGNIVDYHGCDFFPERWFDRVVVLQTDNSILYDRLEKRKYSEQKLQENLECEIMQVVLEEARESYKKEILLILPSNTVEDMDRNVEAVAGWCRQQQQQMAAQAVGAGGALA